ncbi:respiratory chain complex I subunit 1 family protein [Teichococcus oryzae]|uniref:Formate hydrogenlyase n=1 Tax=Teichococcus oryzae TaxID=1608942 RepID=A0A5B2TK45_9PROT|nr:NADH-quinone oxidoreductase subunit H [Pseudoroseomonas oryzae]KAA2214559.1 formate hydrogenlyase [Pseudoroseomonas oryzae]
MTPGAIFTQLVHLALMLALAPLLVGLVRWLKARLMGRRGPSPLQPWRDLAKLARKQPLLAESASVMSVATPYLALAATSAAAALVPGFARGMALAPMADLILVAGLLALSRFALALAAMDVGTAFGDLGAAREMSFAAFAEPAFILSVLCFAILAGSTNLDAIGAAFADGGPGLRISLLLALLALLAVALAENGRMPVDNPATHLELTMVHEAMLLETSGRYLALWEMQAALRLMLWLSLLAALFLPFGTAPAFSGLGGWLLGLLAWVVKLGALAVALAVFESAIAKMRVFRVPEFLGAALLLALLGAVFLFLSTGLA